MQLVPQQWRVYTSAFDSDLAAFRPWTLIVEPVKGRSLPRVRDDQLPVVFPIWTGSGRVTEGPRER